MSSIDKLLIRGIRSFDPQSQNVIEFYTPLTIIVGPNGAGKTTIIECLKYATTGDLPPNSKGGAFIFDPKLAHETEVKAQIRLKFKNVNGRTMIVTRSLQLTQKKAKTEMKTLESLLVTKDPVTGEQVSLSSRCAELDTEIPLHLGVSKSILEDVIFCHQEESSWPLAEPSVLKKKFDDIFAATKYTKALDELKTIKKTRAQEIKLDTQKLEFLKVDTDKAKKIRSNYELAKERIKTSSTKIESFDADLTRISASMTHLMDRIQQINELQNAVERKRHEIVVSETNRNELCNNMTLLTETDTELLNIIKEHQVQLEQAGSTVQELEAKKSQLTHELQDFSKQHSEKCTQKGLLLAEIKAQEQRIETRDKKAREIACKYSVALSSHDLDTTLSDSDLLAIERELRDRAHLFQCQLDTLRSEQRDEEEKINHENQKWLSLQSASSEMKRLKRKTLESHHEKLGSIRTALANMTIIEEDQHLIEMQLKSETDALQKLKDDLTMQQYEMKITTLEKERGQIEREMAAQQERMSQLNRQTELRTKFELKKTEKSRKEVQIEHLIESNRSDIISALGKMPSREELERDIDRVMQLKNQDLSLLQERYDEANLRLSSLNTKYDMAQSTLSKKEAELANKLLRIEPLLHGRDYKSLYDELEDSMALASKTVSERAQVIAIYEGLIHESQEAHACALCSRGWSSLESESASILQFRSKRMGAGKAVSRQTGTSAELTASRDLSAIESRLAELKSIRAVADDVDRLRRIEIPELKASLSGTLAQERELALHQLDDLAATLSHLKMEEKLVSSLKAPMSECSRLAREARSLATDITFMEEEIGLFEISSSSSQGPMPFAPVSLTELQCQIAQIRNTLEKMQSDLKSKQREIQLRELRYRDLKDKLRETTFQVQEKGRLEDEKSKILFENEGIDKDLKELEVQLGKLAPELERLKMDREDLISRFQRRESALSEERRLFDVVRTSYAHSCTEVLSPRSSSGSLQFDLESLATSATELEARIVSTQAALSSIRENSAASARRMAQVQVIERNVRDNLRYREMNRSLDGLKSSLESHLKEVARIDPSDYQSQLNMLKSQQSSMMSQRAGLLGEIKQLEDQVFRVGKELDSDYFDVDENYRNQFIRVKTSEMVCDDLDKYAKALDSAIMRYHSFKMEEINKIIRELWVNTYQGSDIDTIEIRSDTETTRGNRSYNYRVVMMKGDTELDMRGRSSAGQRVLTSIIIRLALAETFGLHCGILALDEPTTNLDRANIESLAESLANIIKTRRRQSNFQLIVITHDEDFVNLLGKSEFADYYWRVSRNENQHSIIERQSITANPT